MAKTNEGVKWGALMLTLILLASSITLPVARASDFGEKSTFAARQDFDEDSITFDNLLPAGGYSLYIEMRNVGQQVKSGGFAEILGPLLPIVSGGAREVTELVAFVTEHADQLSRSRMMVAAMAANASLPQVVFALEMSSPDGAKEFEPAFRSFLSSMMHSPPGVLAGPQPSAEEAAPQPNLIKRAGSLLIVSDAQFSFKSLRREDGKLLSNDPNFRAARDRFYSEILFVYYDMALSERAASERYDSYDTASRTAEMQTEIPPPAEQTGDASVEAPRSEPVHQAPAVVATPEVKTTETGEDAGAAASGAQTSPPRKGRRRTRAAAQPKGAGTGKVGNKPEIVASVGETPAPDATDNTNRGDQFEGMLSFLFSGSMREARPPQSIALALGLDGDELLIHALLINEFGAPASPLPFFTSLVSGPPLPPEAAAYAPSDTEIFVSASLDLARNYISIFDMAGGPSQLNLNPGRKQKEKTETFEMKIAAFEKKHGFKVKDVLLASLGNEVALSAQGSLFSGRSSPSGVSSSQISQAGPILFISVQDKVALQPKLVPILELLGLKTASEKGVTEKHGEIEITSYSKLSFAFINNFLLLAQNAASLRRAIEAYTTNQTLVGDRDFHNYMRWQPRNLLAQVYVSSAIMKGLLDETKKAAEETDDETREFIEQLNFAPEPITYAAESDIIGPHYELHLPKSLILMMIAQMTTGANRGRIPANEGLVRYMFTTLHEAEVQYQSQHGRFASADELEEAKMFDKSVFDGMGYSFELSASGGRYQATAAPLTYGKTGRVSFYIDETGVIREGDHEGKPATGADKASSQTGKN